MRKNIDNYLAGVIEHPLKFRPGILIENAHAEDIKEVVLNKHPGISLSNPENLDILDDYGPWYISYKKIDDSTFGFGYSKTVAPIIKNTNEKSYKTLENAYCGRIDHPHSLLSLNNSFFKEGDSIKIGYLEGEIKDLLVVVERRKINGERYLSDAYLLKVNEAFIFKYESEITSIYIGDNSKNCSEPGVQLKPFITTISKI
jgi:hypothetical protein